MGRGWIAAAMVSVLGGCSGEISGPFDTGDTPPTVSPSAPQMPLPLDPTKPPACDPQLVAGGPTRLWRLTEEQYVRSVRTLFEGVPDFEAPEPEATLAVRSPFTERASADRFSTQSASYSMSEQEMRDVLSASREIAASFVQTLPPASGDCLNSGSADCIVPLISDKGRLLFRRPLSDDEVAQYATVATAGVADLGPQGALQLAFEAMLASPQHLFRVEVGAVAGDGDVRRLSPHEIAAALAFTLRDSPPDESLWQAADRGGLASAEGIRAQVLRLLSGEDSTAAIVRFFRQHVGYERAHLVFKDSGEFKFHDAEALKRSFDTAISRLFTQGDGSGLLDALFTGGEVLANERTYTSFGLDELDTADWQPFDLSKERSGLITHPAVLTTFSHMDENDAVGRGKLIATAFLCQSIPDAPIEVDATLPDLGPDATMRERLSEHTKNPGCATCHSLMDPLGLAFEQYDHVGRFLDASATADLDLSGVLSGAGSADGEFTDVRDLGQRLASSEVVSHCLVRYSFDYWAGRPPAAGDGCALQDMHTAFSDRGGDLRELLVAYFTSDAFTTRQGPDAGGN